MSEWNRDWEYENQDILKSRYEVGAAVRRILCKGCGRVFYTRIASKKYCYYALCGNRGYRKELQQRRLERRVELVCKGCGKTFTPKRSDAVYCSNACRQRAYNPSGIESDKDLLQKGSNRSFAR